MRGELRRFGLGFGEGGISGEGGVMSLVVWTFPGWVRKEREREREADETPTVPPLYYDYACADIAEKQD